MYLTEMNRTPNWSTCFAAALWLLGAYVLHAEEKFNRGLIAVVNSDGQPYIGWRLLKDDPANVAFNVYRQSESAALVKVNASPITSSTNLVDTGAPGDKANSWFVRAVVGGREQSQSEKAILPANSPQTRSLPSNSRAITRPTRSRSPTWTATRSSTT
jgi:hypothetical protein